MPLPSLSPGGAPPFIPSTNASVLAATTTGGGIMGLILTEVRGVCWAPDSVPLTDSPLWVRLDDPTGPFIVSGWSIQRGRQYELDRTGAGTATVTIIDTNGSFDPTNTSGPFAGKLNPMKQAAIAIRNPVTGIWTTLFHGFVRSWSFDLYHTNDFNVVELELVDGMEVLAAREMIPGTDGNGVVDGDVYYLPAAQVSHRITDLLDEAGWPLGLREIFTGNVKVKETVYSRQTDKLAAIQDAADAEWPGVANFYFSKTGWATFHGRLARFNPTVAQYHISTWKAGDTAAVAADSTRAIIHGLEWARDGDKIINSCLAMPQGLADTAVAAQLVEDATSIANYGRKSLSFDNLLTDGGYIGGTTAAVETRKVGTYYVNNYKDPRTRVSQIKFLARIGPDDPYADRLWRLVCGVEISDRIDLVTSHGGGGGFNEMFYVEGLRYTAAPLAAGYLDVELTCDVSPASYYTSNPF